MATGKTPRAVSTFSFSSFVLPIGMGLGLGHGFCRSWNNVAGRTGWYWFIGAARGGNGIKVWSGSIWETMQRQQTTMLIVCGTEQSYTPSPPFLFSSCQAYFYIQHPYDFQGSKHVNDTANCTSQLVFSPSRSVGRSAWLGLGLGCLRRTKLCRRNGRIEGIIWTGK